MMIVTQAEEKVFTLIKSLKNNLQVPVSTNVQIRIVYTVSKLSFYLKIIKDRTQFEQQHDIVKHSFCSAANCNENHIGENGRPLYERMKDHNGQGSKSNSFKHSVESGHNPVLKIYFRIIGRSYSKIPVEKKIAEAL